MSVTPEKNALAEAASGGDLAAADLPALIWEGVARLGPKTHLLVDLTVGQGLADTEAGLGITDLAAPETIARTRERVEQALSIFVLVKTRVNACPGLRRVVGAHARVTLESGLVDVVDDHLGSCGGCADAWSRIPPPFDVLRGSLVLTPTPGLRERIWERIRGRARRDAPGSRLRNAYAALAAAVLVLALGSVAVMISSGVEAADAEVAASPRLESPVPTQAPTALAGLTPTTTTTPHPTTSVVVEAESATEPPIPTTVVPSEPPLVTIITPINGQRFAGSSGPSFIDLVAFVEDDIDDGLTVDWYAGSTYLGTGNAITVSSASGCSDPVKYTVSATVTDSSGNTTRETVTFIVGCPDG